MPFVALAGEVGGLVREHQDGFARGLPRAAVALEGDVEERPADGRLQVREAAVDERDTESVASDPRVRVPVVTTHDNGLAGDARRLLGEASLDPYLCRRRERLPGPRVIDPHGRDEETRTASPIPAAATRRRDRGRSARGGGGT